MAGEVLNATLAPVGVREKEDAGDPVYLRIRDLVYQTCGIYHSDEKLYLLVAAASLVQTHGQAGSDAQFLQSLSTLQSRYQVADSTLNDVVQAMTQAVSLGTEGANGTLNDADRQAIASQVQGILTQTVSLANTSYQGSYLFAGTKVNTQPFTLDTTNNSVTYNGNSATTKVELSNGDSISANLPGDQLFQNASGNVTSALTDLYNALTTNTNIPASVTEVSNALSQVTNQRVFYGNALNQINVSESFLNQDQLNLSQQENSLVGADMATVATNFAQAQIANQATLNATAKVLSLPTLLDFLK
jgi:flagellar hook-associated protein 3 FlgL